MTPVNEEAKYQVSAKEFADFLTKTANATVFVDNSVNGVSTKITYEFDGDKGKSVNVIDSDYIVTTLFKVVGGAMSEVDVSSDPTSPFFVNRVDDGNAVGFTSVSQFQRKTLFSNLFFPKNFFEDEVGLGDVTLGSLLESFFPRFSYDTATHSYQGSFESESGRGGYPIQAKISLSFLDKKIVSIHSDARNDQEVNVVAVSFDKLGTTSVVIPAAAENYVTPIPVRYFDGDGTTLLETIYHGYGQYYTTNLNNHMPAKAAPDATHSYHWDGGWDVTSVPLTGALDLKPVFSLVENSTVYSLTNGYLTFNSQINAISNFVIPTGVTSISLGSYFNSRFQYSLTLGKDVTSVNSAGSTSMIDFSLDGGNTAFAIKDHALYSADKTVLYSHYANDPATSFALDAATTEIKNYAFSENNFLKSITFNNVLTTIGENAFLAMDALVEAILPDSVTSLGAFAFSEDTSLVYVHFSNGLTALPDSVAKSASALQRISFSSSLVSIDASAFEYCSMLLEVPAFPKSFTSFGSNAFAGTRSLKQIDLSASGVQVLSPGLFAGSGLTTLLLPTPLMRVEMNALAYTNLSSFRIAPGVQISESAFRGIPAMAIRNDNLMYTLSNGSLYNLNKTRLLYVGPGKRYIAPESLTSIASGAGQGHTDLKMIDFSEVSGTLNLESSAFENTGVTDFAYPTAAGAKLIYGERSFASSSALTSLALPSNVGLSGDSIFSNAFSLTSVDLSKSGLTSLPGELFESAFQLTEVKLPSTLTTIEYNAFGQTASLKSVVIPSSVTSVNSRSFYYAVEAFYLEANSVPSGFEDGWNNDCPVYLYSDVTPATTPEKYWHYVAGVPTIYPQA